MDISSAVYHMRAQHPEPTGLQFEECHYVFAGKLLNHLHHFLSVGRARCDLVQAGAEERGSAPPRSLAGAVPQKKPKTRLEAKVFTG